MRSTTTSRARCSSPTAPRDCPISSCSSTTSCSRSALPIRGEGDQHPREEHGAAGARCLQRLDASSSVDQLGQLLPARYAKAEVSEDYVEAID
ncbi:MAG: hypothetical protein U5K43_15685 [Halofilum sp. (in: g-proteobacteria)]|nr:hypothetical protein [Halofilum sp. (in: g-proteobacteria)]